MGDMLVPLYKLAPYEPDSSNTWIIRRPIPPEKHLVIQWVREHFSEHWASECEVACTQTPASCLIAIQDGEILGFACFDVTYLNFFGPTGVSEKARGKGIGSALLLESLHALQRKGYAYAIIGGAGPVAFYKKAVGAIEIPDSDDGAYKGMLQTKEEDNG
ncbi:GNAT family N-acetyltransferase [Gracilibacillus sp. D59]|uniref:GNAT family N-acetyltransferase n=1 Tax=Gracilibacillus sp. D59 TaxID=3457434 RepID=UPI003FCE9545